MVASGFTLAGSIRCKLTRSDARACGVNARRRKKGRKALPAAFVILRARPRKTRKEKERKERKRKEERGKRSVGDGLKGEGGNDRRSPCNGN